MSQYKVLCLSREDNVAVALSDIPAGSMIQLEIGSEPITITLLDHIHFGHKLAIKPIKRGEEIKKYGEVIGVATSDILRGNHVHVHNIKSKQRGEAS